MHTQEWIDLKAEKSRVQICENVGDTSTVIMFAHLISVAKPAPRVESVEGARLEYFEAQIGRHVVEM